MESEMFEMVFCSSTAEDEENYFNGDSQSNHDCYEKEQPHLQEGVYRVVDGELFRLE